LDGACGGTVNGVGLGSTVADCAATEGATGGDDTSAADEEVGADDDARTVADEGDLDGDGDVDDEVDLDGDGDGDDEGDVDDDALAADGDGDAAGEEARPADGDIRAAGDAAGGDTSADWCIATDAPVLAFRTLLRTCCTTAGSEPYVAVTDTPECGWAEAAACPSPTSALWSSIAGLPGWLVPPRAAMLTVSAWPTRWAGHCWFFPGVPR